MVKEYCKNNKYKWIENTDNNSVKYVINDTNLKDNGMVAPYPCMISPGKLEKIIGNNFKSCLVGTKDYSEDKCKNYIENENFEDDEVLKTYKINDNTTLFRENIPKKFTNNKKLNFPFDSIEQYIIDYNRISNDTKSTEDYSTDNKNILISDINDILNGKSHKEYCEINKKDCLDVKELQSYLDIKGIKDKIILKDIIKYSNKNGIKNNSSKVLREEVELYLYSIDTRLPDSKISDTNLNPLYPQQIQQIKEQYTNNDDFRKCVNLNLDEKDLTTLKNMKTLNNDNIKLITKVLRKFSELPPYNIYACMEKLDNFEPSKVCNGLLIQEYLQLVEVIMLYFDSQIMIDTSNPEQVKKLMNESIPYMKTIFKNLIDYSYLYPKCKNNGENPKLKIYENIYNNLFPKTSYIKYTPFENVDFGTNFFEQFTTSLHGRIILLIFIAFIFAQIVKLFTNQPVEVPVK